MKKNIKKEYMYMITEFLRYTIGINNIVNHLYLNKNKKKRKEKGKIKKT